MTILNDSDFLKKAERGSLPKEPEPPIYRLPRPLFVPGENAWERQCNRDDNYYQNQSLSSSPGSSSSQDKDACAPGKTGSALLSVGADAFLHSTSGRSRAARLRSTEVSLSRRQQCSSDCVEELQLLFARQSDTGRAPTEPRSPAAYESSDVELPRVMRKPALTTQETGTHPDRHSSAAHAHSPNGHKHPSRPLARTRQSPPTAVGDMPLPVVRVAEGRRRGLHEMVGSALQTDLLQPPPPRERAATKALRLARREMHRSNDDIAALDDRFAPTLPVSPGSALEERSWTRLPERKVIEDMVQANEKQRCDVDEYEGSLGMISQFVRSMNRDRKQHE